MSDMEVRRTCTSLFLLIMVIRTSVAATTTTIPRCQTDETPPKDACLLPSPVAMKWEYADKFCRSKNGFLIGPDEMSRPEVNNLVRENVIWTALGPQLQWFTQHPVKQEVQWEEETEERQRRYDCAALHLPSQLFQPKPCFLFLPSICLLVPEEETFIDVDTELKVMVDGGDTNIVEKDGWVTVTQEGFHQVSLTCLSPDGAAVPSLSLVSWNKDGVSLQEHNSVLVPTNIYNSSLELLQGTYWCEVGHYVSNKVLLTLEGQEVLLLHLQDRQYPESPSINMNAMRDKVHKAFSYLLQNVQSTINVVSIVKDEDALSDSTLVTSRVEIHLPSTSIAFANVLEMLQGKQSIEKFLETAGFLPSSTASLPTQCRKQTEDFSYGNFITWPFSEVGKVQPLHYRCEAADGRLVVGHCRWNYTHGATVHFDRHKCKRFDFCPQDYTGLAGTFCVSRTSATTWDEGFNAEYMSKYTLSLLDAAELFKEEVLLSLYQEVKRWLEDEGGSRRFWLPAKRLTPFAPLVIRSPNFASTHSSNSSGWMRIYNVSWAAGQPSAEQDCLALDTKYSILLTLPCDDALPFLTVLDMRGLFAVPSQSWRVTTPNLIVSNSLICPGWLGSEYPGGQGICFNGFPSKVGLRWHEAVELCKGLDAQLPDPSNGFLDWALRQYLFDNGNLSVWIRFPPHPESRETEGRSGTFLNWRTETDPSLPYPALTFSGWMRQGSEDTKKFVVCQRNMLVPEMTMKVFEESGSVRVAVQPTYNSTATPPQCYVNGYWETLSQNEINPWSNDEEMDYETGSRIYSEWEAEDIDYGSGYESPDSSISSKYKSSMMVVNSISQGYYKCWVWMNSPLRLIMSNVLLFTQADIITFSVVLSRQSQYIPELHDAAINPKVLSSNEPCVVDFLGLVQKDLDNTFRDVTTENFYFSPETQTNNLLLHFHIQFNINDVSSVPMERLESKAEGAINTAFSQLSNKGCHAVSAKSTLGCNENVQWNLTWPATRGVEVVLPAEFCVTDEGNPVIRECLGNFISGYHWGTKYGECSDQLFNTTRQLWNINQVNSSSDSALLAELTDHGHSLNAADVYFIAQKMQSISHKSLVVPRNLDHIVETLNNVMEAEDKVFEQLQGVFNTSNILLQAFEDISFKVKLPLDKSDQVVQSDSRLVSIARVSLVPSSSIIGYHSWRKSEEEEEEEENVIRKENEENWQHSQVSLILPDNLTQQVAKDSIWNGFRGAPDRRVQIMFAIYHNSKLFNDNSSFPNHTVDGHIIQAKYSGHTITNLQQPVRIYFKTNSTGYYSRCVFWDFGMNEGHGGWSTVGCRSDGRHGDHVVCLCNHLTSFAHLVNFSEEGFGGVHKMILDTISIIGCALSIASLLMVVVTFFLFQKWRRRLSNQILVNLAFATLASLIVFLAGIQQTLIPTVCRTVAVALHYLILASFGWMLVEAVHQYLRLVKVLGTYIPRFIWKASVCAWGVPLVPIIAVLVYDTSLYDSDQSTENKICWMSSMAFKYAFLPPLAFTMAINLIVFVLIIQSTTCGRVRVTSTQSERQLRLMQLQMAISVFSLLGFTWVFGLLTFWQPNLVFSYLFCITNTTQGFFLFLFHVFRERDARKLWRDFLSVVYKNSSDSQNSTALAISMTSKESKHSTEVTA